MRGIGENSSVVTLDYFSISLQEIKDVEIQFTMGEALVAAALGMNSPESRDPWMVKEEDFMAIDNATSELQFILEELLGKHVNHHHPNVKQVYLSQVRHWNVNVDITCVFISRRQLQSGCSLWSKTAPSSAR